MPTTPTKHTTITKAFCYRSGHVGFGTVVPKGAIFLMSVPTIKVRETIEVQCRLSKTTDDIFIPGVPEADNDDEALNAVKKFIARVQWCLLPNGKRPSDYRAYVQDKTGIAV